MFHRFTKNVGRNRLIDCYYLSILKNYYSTYSNQEKQYLGLIQNIMANGEKRYTRNGYTYSIFGHQMRYSLKNNT
jgi:hypothetical protein